MNRKPAYPTYIFAAGYDHNTNTLEVELQSGAVYQYYDLPKKIYDEFEQAKSKTRYYNANIRDVYAFSRVDKLYDDPI